MEGEFDKVSGGSHTVNEPAADAHLLYMWLCLRFYQAASEYGIRINKIVRSQIVILSKGELLSIKSLLD